jgi:hypothetical protein
MGKYNKRAKKYHKQYYARPEVKAKQKKYMEKYYKKHKADYLARNKISLENPKNLEKYLKYQVKYCKAYREAHRKEIAANSRKYYKKHKKQILAKAKLARKLKGGKK